MWLLLFYFPSAKLTFHCPWESVSVAVLTRTNKQSDLPRVLRIGQSNKTAVYFYSVLLKVEAINYLPSLWKSVTI